MQRRPIVLYRYLFVHFFGLFKKYIGCVVYLGSAFKRIDYSLAKILQNSIKCTIWKDYPGF